ncbi:hypothetical protein CYFUS_006769 [Cystobacter fuscus]|uniref:DUF1634 domain-containing protein n=1 Tax=Cystobacter fuscus TaxID=43 RepID=A0A250JBM0_9BACT|nr:hypothetical protein [Cystobacter fuscus]ATB41304.1 hypothetical protein CYFUS_006769 [Cystobacter fuscus]
MDERGEMMTKKVSVPVAQWVPQRVRPRAVSGSYPAVPRVGTPSTSTEHIARAEAGERWISRLLRGGAACSGVLFLTSLALESLPDSEPVHVAIDVLRKGAASALLVTPVVRLVVAGTTLGIRGEWRYAAYAAGVLSLLAVAVGAGFHA